MTDNCLVYAVMCESWMYFPKKNVCEFLVHCCVQLQCSPDVNLLLDGKFLTMLLLLRVI